MSDYELRKRSDDERMPLHLIRSEVEELRELARSASARKESSSYLIEGPHLLERALESAPKLLQKIVVTEKAAEREAKLLSRAAKVNIPQAVISEKHSERISDTKTPQGIYATVKRSPASVSELASNGKLLIALDGVQDPGNVGTIIRTASWFGIGGVLLGEGCADVYSPKVLRATQGEIFSVAVVGQLSLPHAVTELKKRSYSIVSTTLSTKSCSIFVETPPTKCVIVFGSEASGVSQALIDASDSEVMIPRFGTGESLNVATSVGIIIAETIRRVSK